MIFKTPHFSLNTKTLQIFNTEGIEVKVYNKDYELLKYLCEVNEAKSGLDILENVWDRNGSFSSNVVASSIANIRRVLGRESIKTVRNCYMVEVLNPLPPTEKTLEETQKIEITSPKKEEIKENIQSRNIFFVFGVFGIIFVLAAGVFFFFNQEKSPVIVSEIQVDAKQNDNENLQNEWIRIKNVSTQSINLKNWSISDETGHTFTFFENRILEPKSELQLVTGVCENTRTQICWNRTSYAVWNNDHDTVFIRDNKKNLIYKYEY